MKVCTKCGFTTERDAKFCFQCGSPMEDFEVAAQNVEAVRIAKTLMEEAKASQLEPTAESEGQPETVHVAEVPTMEKTQETVKGATTGTTANRATVKKQNNTLLYVIIAVLIVAVIGLGAFIFLNGSSDINNDDGEEVEEILDDEEDMVKDEEEEIPEEQGTEAELEYGAPVFTEIYASSELVSDGENIYTAVNLGDNDYSTAWVEGVEGNGEGEYIVFSGHEPQQVSKITIVNGYWKSEEVYSKNSAVKELEIRFSSGEKESVVLNHGYGKVTEIALDEPIVCEAITMKIKSVYSGTECEDTCISEIFFE